MMSLYMKIIHQNIFHIFNKNNVKATFFTLGCVAERHPDLIKEIVEQGHELASHGYAHQKATTQTPDECRDDLIKAKTLLESISGQKIIGYRAPSFSISEENEWAFEIIKETGHLYSSSTYSIAHDHYGSPDWPDVPHEPVTGLMELPQASVKALGRVLPAGGGGYFRLFPYCFSKRLIKLFSEQKSHPYIFYFHPWEVDPEQPVVKGASVKSQFRHRVNLGRMLNKIDKLTKDFAFVSISDAFDIKETV